MPRAEREVGHSVEALYRSSQPCYSRAGGFLTDDGEGERESRRGNARQSSPEFDPIPELDGTLACLECKKVFGCSFLFTSFACAVCNSCRDDADKHRLITRTEAKSAYLLKDCDLDTRQPPLRYLHRKNPRNPRYGDMKLYLRSQVEQRAIAVWGSLEAIERAQSARKTSRDSRKNKRYEKKLSQMRKEMRGDIYDRPKENHQHNFGEERYDAAAEKYTKSCLLCNFTVEYEKM